MSDIFLDAPSPEEKPSKSPNVFLQLIKGFCYFALFFASQMAAMLILMIYYAVKKVQEWQQLGQPIDRNALSDYMLQMVQEDSNGLLLIYALLLVLFLVIFFAIRKKNFFEETGIRKFPVKLLPSLLILTVGLILMVNGILNLLPASLLQGYSEASEFLGEGTLVMSMFTQALLAPLTEELTFRGLMLSRFRKAMPLWVAIAISSVTFGVVHGHPVWFVYATLLGSFFCVVYSRTGSILSTILIHALFNAFGTAMSYAPEGVGIPFAVIILAVVLGIPITIIGFQMLFRQTAHNK